MPGATMMDWTPNGASSSARPSANPSCANLLTDNTDCGACGHQCGDGFSCFLGTCRCAQVGQEYCNGQCIDVLSDRNNCGACGNVCPAGEDCIAASCQPPCDQPCHGLVNNICVPLCDVDQVCVSGRGWAYEHRCHISGFDSLRELRGQSRCVKRRGDQIKPRPRSPVTCGRSSRSLHPASLWRARRRQGRRRNYAAFFSRSAFHCPSVARPFIRAR